MAKIALCLMIIMATGCVSQPIFKKNDYMQCRLEIYCNNTENSLLKKAAFKALSIYFKADINPTLCDKYYQAWGMDYRKPAQERCGNVEDFKKLKQ